MIVLSYLAALVPSIMIKTRKNRLPSVQNRFKLLFISPHYLRLDAQSRTQVRLRKRFAKVAKRKKVVLFECLTRMKKKTYLAGVPNMTVHSHIRLKKYICRKKKILHLPVSCNVSTATSYFVFCYFYLFIYF